MTAVYDWILGIACYLMLISVLMNLLPGRQYLSYLRLPAGLILILLVLKPVLGVQGMEEQLVRDFASLNFQNEADDFKRKLDEQERNRMHQIVAGYEQEVTEDIDHVLSEQGIAGAEIRVTIEEDSTRENFGRVKHILIRPATAVETQVAEALMDRLRQYYDLEAEHVEMEYR